jgi:uncharacterized membrane protein YkvA (DUF1232 family)
MGKNIAVAVMAIASLIYIINPTLGVFEIIPDNLPFIGNLDEATATALLLACLRYFGWDITKLLEKPKDKDKFIK